jgi:nitroimidazol reductase NimA-like FMN-containing flavoprotein (pyridoxamine 5'-phosphate oxidase superfamily)
MICNLPEDKIEALLKNGLIGRIGCHADGVTNVILVSYAYDGACIYVHSHEGMKMALMRKNPAVCFEVDDTTDTANWQSVIAWGRFEEVAGPEERNRALRILNDRVLPLQSSTTMHLGASWPFSAGELSEVDGLVFRIYLTKKTGRFESSTATPAFNY